MYFGFITDRTEADILEQTDKVFFNLLSFYRIWYYAMNLCKLFGLDYTEINPDFIDEYEQPQFTFIPKVTDYAEIEAMLQTLKTRYLRTDLSLARPFNTWQRWNEIETFLEDRTNHVIEVEASKPYCGEFYCGEYGLI